MKRPVFRDVRAARCPMCGAESGERCHRLNGQTLTLHHQLRVDAAARFANLTKLERGMLSVLLLARQDGHP